MIGQYLSNTNEIDTIYILQNILKLNKALVPKTSQAMQQRFGIPTSRILGHKLHAATGHVGFVAKTSRRRPVQLAATRRC